MGLQRKQGDPANEGEQYDIRMTVDEFKKSVANYYMTWKPGMEICGSHVRRRNIPNFVFPGGVCPRLARLAGEKRQVSSAEQVPDCKTKRMLEDGDYRTDSRATQQRSKDVNNIDEKESGDTWSEISKSIVNEGSKTLTNLPTSSSWNYGEADASVNPVESLSATDGATSYRAAEKHKIENIMPSLHQPGAELEEREVDIQYKAQANSFVKMLGRGSD